MIVNYASNSYTPLTITPKWQGINHKKKLATNTFKDHLCNLILNTLPVLHYNKMIQLQDQESHFSEIHETRVTRVIQELG